MTAKKTANKKQEKNSTIPKVQSAFLLKASLVLILITAAVYYKSLNNKLTNWDDEHYLTLNADVKTLHGDSISYSLKKDFTGYVMGNYHPITMLTYSMEYAKYKLNSKPYHVTNLIIHILNTLLVLYFVWLLTQQQITAFITALLFAIHPMHVESVAWVAERKDVLYTFFSLAALCDYVRYSTEEKRKKLYYSASLVMFTLAVLSKAMAVCTPLIFILIDYFKGRKITLKTMLEKVPFFLISITFGIVAIFAQKSLNALEDVANYNFFDRILFSSYGVLLYLWKLLLPVNLTCFYSYPVKQNGMYPGIFYLAPIVIIAVSFLIYKSKKYSKDVIFGFGFFIVSILLVLQILPVGGAIIAERYTYVPYIGIFFIAGRFFNGLFENEKSRLHPYKIVLTGGLTIVVLCYCYLAFKRTKVWENSITLWTDAIEKYDKAPRAYSHRANAYYQSDQFEKAIGDYNSYIFIKNDNPEMYYNRALCFVKLKKYAEALDDFNTMIRMKPESADGYYDRGIVYDDLEKYDDAIKDYSKAIQCKPDYSQAIYNRARAYYMIHKYQLALKDALKAKELGYNVDPKIIETLQIGATDETK